KDLAKLEKEIASYRSEIERLGQATIVNYQAICQQAVLNLRGQSEDVCSLMGEAYNREDMLPIHQEARDLPAIYNVYLHQLVLSYLFRDYEQALANSADAQQYIEALIGSPVFSLFYFYDSLSRLAMGLTQPQANKKEIFKKVRLNQKKLKRWAKDSPENYQHRYYLVEAECAQLKGQASRAKEFYGQAISLAHQHDYLHEEALASERTALFYLETAADQRLGAYYLRDAYYGYRIWGALAKTKQLEELYPELLSTQSLGAERPLTISITTSNENQDASQQLDFDSLLRVSRAISEEIILDKLITALMKTVLENAGAEKGFLLLETSGDWRIEASSAVNASPVNLEASDAPKSLLFEDLESPVLSRSIVNYVIRTQESIVIDDAANQGRFIRDPYIVEHQPQSILCTPLLNQGNLAGIIYLENNLATEAFTPQRIKLLKIICSQAAISIENARLYEKLKDYSYTLEQSVEERTKELSQTLNVLKATQAELIFENDLLKGSEDVSTFSYQVGGSLPMDSPAYVVRAADKALHKALRKGEFCYILNTRQMGKSSLMVRMMNYLRKEDVCCAAIDMTQIGSETVTVEQWYKGLAVELWRSFNLRKRVKLRDWWAVRKDLSPVQRLSQFIEEIVLAHVGVGQTDDQTDGQTDDQVDVQTAHQTTRQIVVFIDEIDSVLGLKFPVDDFFRLIRSCYNQRTVKPGYGRLTFAFFGVATPSMLMRERTKTPFNIGQSIQLKGFKEHEAQPLLYGLSEKVANPQVLLKEILAWTGGQPFLTQRLCKLIRDADAPIPTNEEAEWVETLVQTKIIENWESQDEPEHLRTIRDRLLYGEQSATQLLTLYRQILVNDDENGIASVDSPLENELLLTGLVINQQGVLIVHNRAYRLIFDLAWVESQLDAQLKKQTALPLEAAIANQ
ncbi:MAG: AAA-like domain-containing protein, partial [Cyanobacteria bacterium P01_F01_bin.53]